MESKLAGVSIIAGDFNIRLLDTGLDSRLLCHDPHYLESVFRQQEDAFYHRAQLPTLKAAFRKRASRASGVDLTCNLSAPNKSSVGLFTPTYKFADNSLHKFPRTADDVARKFEQLMVRPQKACKVK